MSATLSKSRSDQIIRACAAVLIGLGAAQSAFAVPYTGWTQPYTTANSPNSPYLFNLDETSGTAAINSGDTVTWGTANGTYSSSASTNINSGAGSPASSAFGKAVVFDGTNTISLPGTSQILGPFSTGFVLETWFRADELPANNTSQAMVTDYYTAQGHPGARHYALSILTTNNTPKLYFNPWRSDGVNVELFGTSAIEAGAWHHAAAQYRSSDTPGASGWELYMDGVLQQRIAASAWAFTEPGVDFVGPANNILLGAYPNGVAGFHGALDDFRITEAPGFDFAAPPPPTPGWAVDGSGDWNLATNWVGAIPNAAGAVASFGTIINSAQSVYTNVPVTVGEIHLDNPNTYVIGGAGNLTLQTVSGTGIIDVQQGSQKINLPLSFASDTNITVADGSTLTIGNPTTINANRTVNVSGNLLIQAPLTIETGGALVIGPGAASLFGAPSLATGAEIDVQNRSLTIDYRGQASPAATIKAQLTSGRNNGAWSGEGINTSSGSSATGLGWRDHTGSKSIEIKYTYNGDADLNGTVNSTDFNALAGSYGATTGAIWTQGDFNYDGKVNTQDFNYLAGNFGLTIPAPAAGLGSAVPEPATLSLLAIGSLSMLTRRRRD